MALYFDMTAMPPPDQMRALGAAEKFIRTQMTAADLVAIMEYPGGAVEVHLDFTDDRDEDPEHPGDHDRRRRPGPR